MKVYLFDSKPFDEIKVQKGQVIKPTQAPDGKWFITKSLYNAYSELIGEALSGDLPNETDRARNKLVSHLDPAIDG